MTVKAGKLGLKYQESGPHVGPLLSKKVLLDIGLYYVFVVLDASD